MNEQEQCARDHMTLSQMEGALKAFLEAAYLAGLDPDDLLGLLDAGLDIKDLLRIIAVKHSSPHKTEISRSPWSDA